MRLRCSSFKDEELERFQGEVDEGPLRMGKEAAEA